MADWVAGFVPVLFHVEAVEFQDLWLIWRGENGPKSFFYFFAFFFSTPHMQMGLSSFITTAKLNYF